MCVFAWGTYYGGTDDDVITALATGYNDWTFFTGYTNSVSSGSPSNVSQVADSPYDSWFWTTFATIGGGYDPFLGIFDSSDHRVWSEYYGEASGNDKSNSIATYFTGPYNEFWYITGATEDMSFHYIINATTGPPVWYCCPDATGFPVYMGDGDAFNARFSIRGHFMTGITEGPVVGLEANIYPNPTTDYINVNFNIAGKEDVFINVFNISGQLIQRKVFRSQTGNFLTTLDLSNYTSGFYFIQVMAGNNVTTKKAIKFN